MRGMRRPALLPVVALILAACTLTSPGSGDTATGVPTEAIEITPLDGATAPTAAAGSPDAAADAADADADADESTSPATVPDDGAATDAAAAGTGAESDTEATESTGADIAEPPPAPALSPAAQACIKRGGKWVGTGSNGLMACVRITRDAGQSCRKEADCQGYCLARSRTCAPYTPLFGCNEVLGPGGERTTICLD
jgi:hypothetical protein